MYHRTLLMKTTPVAFTFLKSPNRGINLVGYLLPLMHIVVVLAGSYFHRDSFPLILSFYLSTVKAIL